MNFKVTAIFFIILVLLVASASQAWEVDFSRRQRKSESMPVTELPQKETVAAPEIVGTGGLPAPEAAFAKPATKKDDGLGSFVKPVRKFSPVNDRQAVVILNTSKGFIPNNVRLHKDVHYTIHVVNVNEDQKNVSFMLDAFKEHHATYFGQIKSFEFDPDKEGVFEFQCPETSAEGKLVILSPKMAPVNRALSSEK